MTDEADVRLRDGVLDSLLICLVVRIVFSMVGVVAVGTLTARADPHTRRRAGTGRATRGQPIRV